MGRSSETSAVDVAWERSSAGFKAAEQPVAVRWDRLKSRSCGDVHCLMSLLHHQPSPAPSMYSERYRALGHLKELVFVVKKNHCGCKDTKGASLECWCVQLHVTHERSLSKKIDDDYGLGWCLGCWSEFSILCFQVFSKQKNWFCPT